MRRIAFLFLLVLVFSIPWEDAVILGGLGTLTRGIGMVAAAAWLASVLVSGELRKPHLFHIFLYLFVLWNTISIFWTAGFGETVGRIKTFVQLAILAWILWDLIRTLAALRATLQAYILGAYISISGTVLNYLAGREVSEYSGGRYAGANLNANDLALILILGLPVAWHLAVSAGNSRKSQVLRWVNFAYIPAALFAIISTGSRMSLFAVVPALLYMLGSVKRLKPFSRMLILVALTGTLFVMQSYIPQSAVNRLGTAFESIANADLGGRVELWQATVGVFLEHPLLGVGSGALHVPSVLGGAAHNTFLSVLAELGPVGFALFVFMLAIAGFESIRRSNWHSGLWLTVLAIWAIGVAMLSWEHGKPTWLFLGLTVLSASLSRQVDQRVLPSESPTSLGRVQSRRIQRNATSDSLALENTADRPSSTLAGSAVPASKGCGL